MGEFWRSQTVLVAAATVLGAAATAYASRPSWPVAALAACLALLHLSAHSASAQHHERTAALLAAIYDALDRGGRAS